MSDDDWDYERARALLRAQVAGSARTTATGPVRVAFRHRVATTVGLAAVASAVIVGSWWATAGGHVTPAAVTADARAANDVPQGTRDLIPALATVGAVQVVTVPAPAGGFLQVVVGPVSATTLAIAAPTDPAPALDVTRTVDPAASGAVVTPRPAAVAPPVRGGSPAPPPAPPQASVPRPSTAPPASTPTVDPPTSSPAEAPPSSAAPPTTPDTPTTGGQTGSGTGRSDETDSSGTS